MKKFMLLSFLIVLCMSTLVGCSDSRSPERMGYAHGLGIDYKNGEYIVYLQLINFGMLAKSEAGSSAQNASPNIQKIASGKNMLEAIFKMYSSEQQEIYFGNLSFIILSDQLLKEKGITPVIDMWNRYPEARYQIFFYTSSGDVEQILKVKPILDVSKSLNRITDPKNSFRQDSTFPFITLREVLLDLNEPNHMTTIPRVFVTKDIGSDTGETTDIVGVDGISLYDRDKRLLGTLIGEDIYGYRWVSGKFYRTDIQLESDDEPLGTVIVNDRKVKIKPIITGTIPRFHIQIRVKGSLAEIDKRGLTFEEIERAAVAGIKKDVMNTYKQALELNADIYRLSEVLYRKKLSVWNKYEQNGKIPLEEDSIEVDVDVQVQDAWKNSLKRSGE